MPVEPADGGAGGSNAATIIFQHKTDEILGGTQMQNVVEVGARSIPSGVYFQFRLPALGYTRTVGQAYANGYAMEIEGLLSLPYVVGISYLQDTNAAGQLLDKADIFWQLEDESASGDVEILLDNITSDTSIPAIQAAMAPYV